MPLAAPTRATLKRSPTMTSGFFEVTAHSALQQEFVVPLSGPSSHPSPASRMPFPQVAAWADPERPARRAKTTIRRILAMFRP
jgi:hypothetical protein